MTLNIHWPRPFNNHRLLDWCLNGYLSMCCLNRGFKISWNQLVRQFNFKITNSFHFKCFDLYQFLLRKDTYYKLCSHGINKHIKVVRYNLCKIGKIDHCKYITLWIIFTRRSLFRRAWIEEIKTCQKLMPSMWTKNPTKLDCYFITKSVHQKSKLKTSLHYYLWETKYLRQ